MPDTRQNSPERGISVNHAWTPREPLAITAEGTATRDTDVIEGTGGRDVTDADQ